MKSSSRKTRFHKSPLSIPFPTPDSSKSEQTFTGSFCIMPCMKDYIFFDLDGTLTDSQEGILNSLRISLALFDIKKTDEQMRVLIGPPLMETFRKTLGLSSEQAEKAADAFHTYYEEKGIFENRVYDGIPTVLESLKKSGKHLAVATSKPELTSIRILEHFNLAPYFDFICGSNMDETRSNKADVIAYTMHKFDLTEKDAAKIIMVGDRNNDIIGAHQNGIEAVGVLYGYGTKAELEKSGANYIVESVEDLGIFFNS